MRTPEIAQFPQVYMDFFCLHLKNKGKKCFFGEKQRFFGQKYPNLAKKRAAGRLAGHQVAASGVVCAGQHFLLFKGCFAGYLPLRYLRLCDRLMYNLRPPATAAPAWKAAAEPDL